MTSQREAQIERDMAAHVMRKCVAAATDACELIDSPESNLRILREVMAAMLGLYAGAIGAVMYQETGQRPSNEAIFAAAALDLSRIAEQARSVSRARDAR